MVPVLLGLIEMLYRVKLPVKWVRNLSIFGLEFELYNAMSSAYAAKERVEWF